MKIWRKINLHHILTALFVAVVVIVVLATMRLDRMAGGIEEASGHLDKIEATLLRIEVRTQRQNGMLEAIAEMIYSELRARAQDGD